MTETTGTGGRAGYREFSEEAKEAAKLRAISGSWELRKLQKLLSELSYFDESNEAAMKKAQTRMIICIVLTFVGIFAAFLLMGLTEIDWGWLLPVAAAGGIVYFGVVRSRLKGADLINDFRLCLQPGLRDIAQDLDPTKRIKVRMDLAGPVKTKQTSKLEVPPGRYMKVTETIFEDPWCEVRLALVDGSTALLDFHVQWVKIERKYRGSRGKIKYKTKWRKRCTAAATLIPPTPVVWNEVSLQARLDSRRERVQILQKEGVTGARMERRWVFKNPSDPPPDAPPAREVVGMLLRLSAAMGAPGGAR